VGAIRVPLAGMGALHRMALGIHHIEHGGLSPYDELFLRVDAWRINCGRRHNAFSPICRGYSPQLCYCTA